MTEKRAPLLWIINLVTKTSTALGYLSGGLVLAMMISLGYDVVARHVFNSPTIWADELSGYLLVAITFLGAAYTLTMDAHVRVDTLIDRLDGKKRRGVIFVTDVVSLVFLWVYGWQAYRLAIDAYVSVKISPTLLRTPIFIPQVVLPIGLTLLWLQLVAHVLQINMKR